MNYLAYRPKTLEQHLLMPFKLQNPIPRQWIHCHLCQGAPFYTEIERCPLCSGNRGWWKGNEPAGLEKSISNTGLLSQFETNRDSADDVTDWADVEKPDFEGGRTFVSISIPHSLGQSDK